jgi:micrococcal nuclease|tara:strand:- start:965 stop:1411 length:447 start_codon:yes stop_codon:yes gene_type:complete
MAKLGDPTDFSYRVSKVVKVVDGDTIDVILDMGFDILYKQRVRLFGIDTPESRTSDKIEKKYGLMSKKFLQDKLKSASKISIKTYKGEETGKFGRILGDVFVDGKSVNMALCKAGHAVPYYGQNKALVEKAHMKNREKLNKYNSRLSG